MGGRHTRKGIGGVEREGIGCVRMSDIRKEEGRKYSETRITSYECMYVCM